VLLNAETGLCDCVFLDNGCLMDLRTGLAGAAAAKHLAPAEVETVGVGSPETLVGQSQIVVTTTQATKALISADWVKPGTHITAMGADLPGKQELDTQILKVADLVACDSVDQCLVGGELQHMAGAGIDREVVELGAITSGRKPMARAPGDITVCDLTGTGAQDTAIADEALRRIREAGGGITVS
jgi:ornithine cyclodeaminase/alanine dehydrogenase-like protein (mu-crystallin family)